MWTPATGLVVRMAISGFRALGYSRPPLASCGHGLLGLAGWHLFMERRLLGSAIGFYGGVNYGFGYGGVGYEGGRWDNGVFAYNRSVNNFGSVTITNVYEKTVVVDPGATTGKLQWRHRRNNGSADAGTRGRSARTTRSGNSCATSARANGER